MGVFEQFPYANMHEMNLDWLLKKMKELAMAMETFKATESLKFADPIIWDISTQYEKSTIVLDPTGNAYLSLQAVPAGIQLNNDEYWLEIFNFTEYTRTANQNLTVNTETNTTRATAPYQVDDWLIWNDVLYRVTATIAIDDALIVAPAAGSNIIHFTVEDFIKAFITYATGLINQYKNEIDASELAYRQQLAQDIAATTSSLQAQLDLAISGATVDSEVINARLGADGVTYSTLGDAIKTQISHLADLNKGQNTTFALLENMLVPLNIFNKNGIIATGYPNSNGTIHASDSWNYELLEVEPSTSYSCTGGRTNAVFFNKYGVVTGSQAASGSATEVLITTPSDAVYMVVATRIAENDTYMVRKSASIITSGYVPYGTYDKVVQADVDNVANALLRENNINRLFEDFVKPLNIFDSSIAANGYFNADGTIHTSDAWNYEYVSVTNGASYSCTGGRCIIAYFDAHNNIVGYDYSGNNVTLLTTAPDTAVIMGISTRIVDNNAFMVRQSDTLLDDPYSPYGIGANEPVVYHYIDCYPSTGDNLRAIIEGITDNTYNNRYIVRVHEGTYDISTMYTASEMEDPDFIGLTIPAYTKLEGIGSRDSIIITLSLSETNPRISTLNLEDTAELENLYIFGHNTRYVVHDDYHHSTRKLENRVIKNVNVVSDRTRLHRLWGAGLANGLVWSFIDCIFTYTYTHDTTMGCFACHNAAGFTDSCYILIDNCRFNSIQPHNILLQTMTTNANDIMCYCKVIGSNGGGMTLTEIDPINYGAGCLWTVTGYSNNFEHSDVTIIVTDGGNYSNQNQIL